MQTIGIGAQRRYFDLCDLVPGNLLRAVKHPVIPLFDEMTVNTGTL
ncbi:MAG: hypothetical protein IJS04_08435 [Muribaculaceae bacterium]|nr:hypothetical protein [Muribaculaceae bacterium]